MVRTNRDDGRPNLRTVKKLLGRKQKDFGVDVELHDLRRRDGEGKSGGDEYIGDGGDE
jgi:hypothetical protein